MGIEYGQPIAAIIAGVEDWGLADWRDFTIIACGVVLFVALLVTLIFTIVVGVAARTVLGSVQTLLKGEVAPILDSLRLTLQRIEGTTSFISETAVSPVIRVYGIWAGAKRMGAVLSGITGRKKGRE